MRIRLGTSVLMLGIGLAFMSCNQIGSSPSSFPKHSGPKETSVTPSEVSRPQGTTSSGGGDSLAAEFIKLASDFAVRLAPAYQKQLLSFPLPDFIKTLKNCKVETSRIPLELGGRSVDALNFPDEQRILVYADRWYHNLSPTNKVSLVVHELLGLMRLDDKNYARSNFLINLAPSLIRMSVTTLYLSGQTAETFSQKMDWSGALKTGMIAETENHTDLFEVEVRVHFPEQGIIACLFLGDFEEYWKKQGYQVPAAQNGVRSCFIDGFKGKAMENDWIVYYAGGNFNQAWWERLAPKGAQNFNYDSIRGYSSLGGAHQIWFRLR